MESYTTLPVVVVPKRHVLLHTYGRLPLDSVCLALIVVAAVAVHLRSAVTLLQLGLHSRLPAARGLQPVAAAAAAGCRMHHVFRRAGVMEVLFGDDSDDDILPAAGGVSIGDDLLTEAIDRIKKDEQTISLRQMAVPFQDLEVVESVLMRRLQHDDGLHDGVYVDLTFGRGGHSRAILKRLSPDGQLHAFDTDPKAVAIAHDLEQKDKRFHMFHQSFGEIDKALDGMEVHGVVLDIGSWNLQVDNVNQGFHIAGDLSVDSHMNRQENISATEWLTRISDEELAWVICEYSSIEPLLAERIAAAVLEWQKRRGPYTNVGELSNVINTVGGQVESRPLARETIDAIRIFRNHEMDHLYLALDGAFKLLATGGCCAVITSTDLQHRTVIQFLRDREEPTFGMIHAVPTTKLCELYPLVSTDIDYAVRRVGMARRPKSNERSVDRSSSLISLVKTPRISQHMHASPRELAERFVRPQLLPFLGGSELEVKT